MNSQIKQLWLDALRSGEYKQKRRKLRDTNSFCCLGVLCDLYAKEHGKEWDYDKGENYYYFEEADTGLAKSVMNWAGLTEEYPEVIMNGQIYPTDLATINDDYGFNFNQIAELIS